MNAKKLRMLLACGLLASTSPFLQAQEEGLRLDFDFEQVSGTTVTDAVAGITATLANGAQVEEMGKYHVLDLGGNSGYLDMTEQTGNLFKSLDTYTVSVYYRVDEDASLSGAGFFLWAFSTSTACTANEGKYSAYRLNAQRFANSTGGFANEAGIERGGESEKGRWMHVLYTQDGATGILYLNGTRAGSNTAMPLNSTNFTSSIPYAWIGRAPFSADNYLRETLVYGFRVYDKVLDSEEIQTLAQATEDLDYEYRYGEVGDFTALQEAIREGEDFIAENASSYPAAAIAIFQDEINMAQTLVNEGRVNQSTIDEQLSALNAAKTTLTATAGFVFNDQGIIEGYDTERGFRHPGALHTEEDFERIRTQLAAGNLKVQQAYNVLVNAEYAQAGCPTAPVETIIRGGGSGQNYINAARGATIAYQNALRWKIDGSVANAQHAVDVLMAWARTTKAISGDSNWALASGLYGYQFANAAELVRDYEGWSPEDFAEFKRWMLDVWYPSCITFLRGRQGTWENAARWWQCPGHYWSNWGLCNALAVVSIGILCDDVFIYNQGMSFFKHDQVGTFEDPRTADPILNDGLTEFLGNLVVTTVESDLETGAYGKLGQMQESGRDGGHAAMAAGLAVDLAHIGWNQGDDLFSYMDHRLAAGIEYLAAQCQSIPNLPWTNYHYASSGFYYTDGRSWLQTGPAMGAHIRPYWGTVIGHYEGVKGVKMPFSEWAYDRMGIDGGGAGATSGGYDHLGYSVLMNTRDGIAAPESVPTELTPLIEYNGTTVAQSDLGGLKNTFRVESTEPLPAGTVVTFKPQLPEGTTDTGNWEWNTGETTKDITVVADRSGVWRATYTNENGVKSEQVFTLAVEGDCEESAIETYLTVNGKRMTATSANVLYGSEVTLEVNARMGWGTYEWENGSTGSILTLPNVTTSRDISAIFTGQGGRRQKATFHLNVQLIRPNITVGTKRYDDTLMVVVKPGTDVTLGYTPSEYQEGGTTEWSDGSTAETLTLTDMQASGDYSVTYSANGSSTTLTYTIYVEEEDFTTVQAGNYYVRHTGYDTYLTNQGEASSVVFEAKNEAHPETQQWYLENEPGKTAYSIQSLSGQNYLQDDGTMSTRDTKRFRFKGAVGRKNLAMVARTSYWKVEADGTIDFAGTEDPNDFPFELIPVEGSGISDTGTDGATVTEQVYYTLDGIRLDRPRKGINIRQTTYDNGQVRRDKVMIR